MRTTWRRAGALAAILVLATGAALADATVIVLSWDGIRHAYLDRGGLPALARMQREGARAERKQRKKQKPEQKLNHKLKQKLKQKPKHKLKQKLKK